MLGFAVEMEEETKHTAWFMNSIKERFEYFMEARGQKIALEVRVDETIDEISTYFDVVDIAIWETLVNAAYYSGASKIVLQVILDANSVRFEIADNGVGIPEDKLHRVFVPGDRLGRTGVGGTGYGLSGAKDAVERIANGSIDVKSTVGAGTTFMVLVPFRSASSGIQEVSKGQKVTVSQRETSAGSSENGEGGINLSGIRVETVNKEELEVLPFYKNRIEPFLGQIDLENFNGFSFEIISIEKVRKKDLLS